MSEEPCHTGAAARVCGYCAEHQAHTERIRFAWHDTACSYGSDCRYRQLCAQGQPTMISQLERFLTRLNQLEKDPAW